MDEQRLNEIRKRAVIVGRGIWYHDDVPDLLVEIDNLCHQLQAADEDRKCWMTSSQNNLDMALEIDARLQAAEAERDRLVAELETARLVARFAAHWMNQYGNIANWPPDMPMEYAEAINKLRAIAPAQPSQPDADDEAVAGTG